MRLWRDSAGNILTDEQVLRYIASFGSIAASCDAGDIELISERIEERPIPANRAARGHRLGDYLDGGGRSQP